MIPLNFGKSVTFVFDNCTGKYPFNVEQYFIDKFRQMGFFCYRTSEVICSDILCPHCGKTVASGGTNEIMCSDIPHKIVRSIIDNESPIGRPDLIVYNSDDYIFVEVKSHTGDRLSGSQIHWILNHPDIPIAICILYNIYTEKYMSAFDDTDILKRLHLKKVNGKIVPDNV